MRSEDEAIITFVAQHGTNDWSGIGGPDCSPHHMIDKAPSSWHPHLFDTEYGDALRTP
jgi:uncharacterized membrane protein